MKKFVEKLNRKLEMEVLGKPTPQEFNNGIYRSMQIARDFADEYEQEVCEWKKDEKDTLFPYKTSCGKFDLYDNEYKYCPYCGKIIKLM